MKNKNLLVAIRKRGGGRGNGRYDYLLFRELTRMERFRLWLYGGFKKEPKMDTYGAHLLGTEVECLVEISYAPTDGAIPCCEKIVGGTACLPEHFNNTKEPVSWIIGLTVGIPVNPY